MRTAAEHFAKADELFKKAGEAASPKEWHDLASMARTWREVGADIRWQEDLIAGTRRIQ